ncbi:hypothetical protein [Spirosoma rhododendri]|uniref:Uncharacterized protein n=1 Tax=Spirosoma rhododendri TaxID=2728024 RepID=A0A7L5DKW9_9BACT|nr:hypothetical protein [Spirosoma rhododendri]QJD78172.1 hypothetical protein HH216_06850 [Spirosoma rhododendri]
MNRLAALWIGLTLLGGSLRGQPQPAGLPVGRFLTDSIEIGRPVQYVFSYHHAPGIDVLFPDTATQFRPFRVTQVAITPTLTTGSLSRDSAVYTLVSFSVDSIQSLHPSVRLVNPADCTLINALPDTVFLRSRLGQPGVTVPGATTLATSVQLAPLQQQFNYPRLLQVVGLLVLGLLVVVLFFGKRLRQQGRLYQLSRRHNRFLAEHDRLMTNLSSETIADTANQVTVAWKEYMERLSGDAYAALTTSEIADLTGDDRVADALRTTDRTIYGGAFSEQSTGALRVLRDVAEQTYVRSRQQILAADTAEPELQPDELP